MEIQKKLDYDDNKQSYPTTSTPKPSTTYQLQSILRIPRYKLNRAGLVCRIIPNPVGLSLPDPPVLLA